jgi:Domain of unknown function (DUF4129)
LILVLVVLLLVILVVLREWYIVRNNVSEDEIREGLSVRSILRARRQRRQKRSKVMLEPLDPTSARARYRELLQAMARQGNELGRRLNETPTEYQTRLQTFFKKTAAEETQKDGTPSAAAILDELTRAYALERYGGKQIDRRQQTYLHRWVPHLMKRFTSSKSTHTSRLHLYLNRGISNLAPNKKSIANPDRVPVLDSDFPGIRTNKDEADRSV